MRRLVVLCVALLGLALVGNAAAANGYKVFVGEQSRPPAALKKLNATLNQFMPSSIVINAGDTVTFSSATFHTVTSTPKPIPLIIPDPKKGTYDGIVDAAGDPFYFDGFAKFVYNGMAFGPFGSKTITGAPASSGILSPAGPKAPPAKVTYTFPKAGTFKLVCTLHVGMQAKVKVLPAGAPVPLTPSQVDAKALAAQTAGWAKAAKIGASVKVGANTVAMGIGGNVSLLAFRPEKLTVKAGTTVTFVNRSPSEVHNVVFGPGKWIERFAMKTDLLPQGPTAPNQVTPILVYGSDPKPLTHGGPTTHGNGFFATPLTAGSPIGLPRSSRVTFSEPGTFKYFCFIHGPDMGGTIVVK